MAEASGGTLGPPSFHMYPSAHMSAVRPLLATLIVATMLLVVPGRVRASESEIPGVPLVARSVSATVGGGVVDRVYRILVPAGSVLIASLSGSEGAELGLYLFDQDATSVLTDHPIASSAKPGGTQGLTATLQAAGEYFFDVNGRNGNRPYSFTLTYAVTSDKSPATIRSVVAPTRAQSANVCMKISAEDPLSGVAAVAISDLTSTDPVSWMPYHGVGSYCVATNPKDGARTFRVVARNGVGLVSLPVVRSVTIDDTEPKVRTVTPKQGATLLVARPTVQWTFNEVVRLGGGSKGSVFTSSQKTLAIPGTASVSKDGKTVSWTPTASISLGSVLLVSLTGVTDTAGNNAAQLDTLEFVRKTKVVIGASLVDHKGDFARIAYRVSSLLIGGEIVLQARLPSGWTELGRKTITATTGSIRAAVGQATAARIVWEGGDTTLAARSGSVSLAR